MSDQPIKRDPEGPAEGPGPADTDEPAAEVADATDDDARARRRAIARGAPRPFSDEERETAYGLLQRGLALMQRRHNAQAAIVLERAAALEPGRGSILEALGRAYYNSGQVERALGTFEALLEVDPSSHYGHYALGQSLKRLGRRREAATHLRLAVALNPQSPLYRSALSRLGPPEPMAEGDAAVVPDADAADEDQGAST